MPARRNEIDVGYGDVGDGRALRVSGQGNEEDEDSEESEEHVRDRSHYNGYAVVANDVYIQLSFRLSFRAA